MTVDYCVLLKIIPYFMVVYFSNDGTTVSPGKLFIILTRYYKFLFYNNNASIW